jgi:acyltransferase
MTFERSPIRKTASHRYGFIDNAKAIGIILIVLGHSRGLPEGLTRLIFSFHVPLFFFISGFLVKSGRLDESCYGNAKKVLQTLGVPYLLFFSFAFLYWLATSNVGAKAALNVDRAWYEPFAGLVTGLESDLYVDPPLWFFPCLILTAIAYQASRKLLSLTVSTWLFTILAFFLSVLWKYSSYRLPLGLDNMWIALSFYAIGQYARQKDFSGAMKLAYCISAFVVASALLAYAVSINSRFDLANMHFGVLPALYLPTSWLGIIATLSISRLLPPSGIGNWLSENTLAIFPAHFIFLSLVRGVATSLHLIPANYNYAIGWSIVSSALAILLCVPLVYFLRRLPLPMYRKAG